MAKDNVNIQITVEELYKILCPECRDKLLSMAASSVAAESVKKQLKEQWENSGGSSK